MGLRSTLIRHFWYEGVGLLIPVTERIELEFLLKIEVARVKGVLGVLGGAQGS